MDCGSDTHSRDEMLQRKPDFRIDCKLLCEKNWLKTLNYWKVFDLEIGEDLHESFVRIIKDRRPVPSNREHILSLWSKGNSDTGSEEIVEIEIES